MFLSVSESAKPRPKVIQDMISGVERYLDDPENVLVSISDIQQRKKRRERREAIVAVAQALCYYTDLRTRVIGTPANDGKFNGLRISFIKEKLNGFGYKRIWRALCDLRKSNYLFSSLKKIRVKGQTFTLMSLRWSDKFFRDIGISQTKMEKCKKYMMRAQQEKKNQEYKKHDLSGICPKLKSMLSKLGNSLGAKEQPKEAPKYEPKPMVHNQPIKSFRKKHTPLSDSQKNERQRRVGLIYDLMMKDGISSEEAKVKLGFTSI